VSLTLHSLTHSLSHQTPTSFVSSSTQLHTKTSLAPILFLSPSNPTPSFIISMLPSTPMSMMILPTLTSCSKSIAWISSCRPTAACSSAVLSALHAHQHDNIKKMEWRKHGRSLLRAVIRIHKPHNRIQLPHIFVFATENATLSIFNASFCFKLKFSIFNASSLSTTPLATVHDQHTPFSIPLHHKL
ncbi:hypothetical protein V8G54_031809, partial [Vigna mungo]